MGPDDGDGAVSGQMNMQWLNVWTYGVISIMYAISGDVATSWRAFVASFFAYLLTE
jgi:hypothetical protein